MRTLLVTSQVTFVPRNYDDLIISLAAHSEICGLVVIQNRSFDILLKSLLLILTLAAPRLGWQLLKNFFFDSMQIRRAAFKEAGKAFLTFDNINSPKALDKLKELDIDLILNARTRSIFKKELLSLPRLGCINIHHGLLPDQRGVMCDFWAHLDNQPSGFSIHEMTSTLDAGRILTVQEVSTDKTDYLESLQEGAKAEVQAVSKLLSEIFRKDQLEGLENIKTTQTRYRRNPRIRDFYLLQSKGIKI